MSHPLIDNLESLSNHEVEEKLLDLLESSKARMKSYLLTVVFIVNHIKV